MGVGVGLGSGLLVVGRSYHVGINRNRSVCNSSSRRGGCGCGGNGSGGTRSSCISSSGRCSRCISTTHTSNHISRNSSCRRSSSRGLRILEIVGVAVVINVAATVKVVVKPVIVVTGPP